MSSVPLPYTPPPCVDEILSSWVERIGLFYGIGYLGARAILAPAGLSAEWGKNEDLDSSLHMRSLVKSWTGHDEATVPHVVRNDIQTLEVSARLAYCPKCWDQDVAKGMAPYIRRQWTRWTCVSCAVHEEWLAARRPGLQFGSALNGWAFVWQSRPRWACSAGLQYDSVASTSAAVFAPDSLVRPDDSWSDFERKLGDTVVLTKTTDEDAFSPTSILGTVIRPEHTAVRMKILRALQMRRPVARVNDSDLRGYNRPEPGWISGRISSLVAAIEIAGIQSGINPVFRRARMILQSTRDGERLMRECDARERKSKQAVQQ